MNAVCAAALSLHTIPINFRQITRSGANEIIVYSDTAADRRIALSSSQSDAVSRRTDKNSLLFPLLEEGCVRPTDCMEFLFAERRHKAPCRDQAARCQAAF